MRNRVRHVSKIGNGMYYTSNMGIGEYIVFIFVKYVLLLPFYLMYWMFKYSIIGIKNLINKKEDK